MSALLCPAVRCPHYAITGNPNPPPRRRTPRGGAATIEFAIVGPIIFLVILATIQFCGLLMCKNALTSAAREGGRLASMPGTNSSGPVIAAVQERLSRSGMNPNLITVSVNPTALDNLSTGDEVTISVSGAIRDLIWVGAVTMPNANLSAQITYRRE